MMMRSPIDMGNPANFDAIMAAGFDAWGPAVEVTEAEITQYKKATLSVSEPGEIPGTMLLSLLTKIVPQPLWMVTGHSAALNMGCLSVRFPAMARSGAPLAGRSRLAEVRSKGDDLILVREFEVCDRRSDQLCLSAIIELLYRKA